MIITREPNSTLDRALQNHLPEVLLEIFISHQRHTPGLICCFRLRFGPGFIFSRS